MTHRVPERPPNAPPLVAHYIGRPYVGGLAQAHTDIVAHMLGHQMSTVANVVFGGSEATSDTWRIAYAASACARAVVIALVPRGSTGSSPTVAAAGAETETPIGVLHTNASVTDLGDIPNPARYRFVVPVTAGALQELSWTTVNTLLHSAHVYEVPRAELLGTQPHVDRTFADAQRYITDNVSASNPRGYTALLNAILLARTNMRRHIVNLPFRAGLTSAGSASPTFDYLIGSATHGIRCVARDVRGGTSTTMPVGCKVRVSALTGGTTHTVRFAFATGGNADITGINATGWWPGPSDVSVAGQAGSCAFADLLTVQSTRTIGGAGTITIDSICVYENT